MALDTTDLLASPAALLDKSLAQHPDRAVVVQGEQVTTYRQLRHAAQGVAAQLHAAGVRSGDAVALSLGNQPSYLAVLPRRRPRAAGHRDRKGAPRKLVGRGSG